MDKHPGAVGGQTFDPTHCRHEGDLIGAGARAFAEEARKEKARGEAARSKAIAEFVEATEPPLELIVRPRPHRARRPFLFVGASVAAGVTLGYLSGSSMSVKRAGDAGARTEVASVTQAFPWKSDIASDGGEKQQISRLSDEIRSLRAQLEQTRRAADSAHMQERLHALEAARDANLQLTKASAESIAKIDRLETRMGQLERISVDHTATGSTKIERAAAPRPNESPRSDAKAAEADRKNARPKVSLGGYVLRDVYRGMALVERRDGLIEEIAQGDLLPGAGRVTAIERRGRDWVVVTTQGVIDQRPY